MQKTFVLKIQSISTHLPNVLTVTKSAVYSVAFCALPLVTNAQFQETKLTKRAGEEAAGFVATFTEVLLAPLLILMTAIALLVFIYGATVYVLNSDNEQARADGNRHMLYGVIGLFVMVSAYAIFWIFVNTFGLDEQFEELESQMEG